MLDTRRARQVCAAAVTRYWSGEPVLSFDTVVLGEGQVFPCRTCRPGTSAVEYAPLAEVTDRIAAALQAAPATGILLAGPEPMGHPALPEIVRFAAAQGAARIGLQTGAGALAHGQNAPGSIATGVRLIEVPLLGADAAEHDARSRTPGAFDAARAGVARFREAAAAAGDHVVVRGRLDVCAHTAASLPATVATFAEWGASSVVLEATGPLARSDLAFVRAACETGTVNRVWVAVRGVAPDTLGPDALHASDVVECRGGRT